MDVGVYSYQHGDPLLIDKIVNEFLSQGKFDKLRKECMSDADTKPAYQNLQQRVENTVAEFLQKQVWKPDLNKNQLRDSLRKHILESVFFDAGINRIVDQVVNPNVLATVFLPEVEEVVYSYLSIPRPPDKNNKRVPVSNSENAEKGLDDAASKNNEKFEKGAKVKSESQDHEMLEEETDAKDRVNKVTEPSVDDKTKINEIQKCQTIRTEVKVEADGTMKNDGSHTPLQGFLEKMEVISDESQESVNRIAIQGNHLNEDERMPVSESDNSIPLEINEKSMSESGDSEDSIMNQMSPISQGRLTPDLMEEEKVPEKEEKEEKEEKAEKEEKGEKKPLTFIGRIPKIKREDSETSKSSKGKEEVSKREKLDVKHVYSSDESDSSKSLGKSDSDERKSKEKKRDDERNQQKDDKKSKGSESERKKKHDYHHKDSRDRDKDKRHRDDKSKDRSSKDQRRERSRERREIKKSSSSSSSSYSREKSSSRHKSSRHESRRRSKEGSHERRRKEHEKRKGKSTDDHGKERNKKEERRSTDRDSNEGEVDKSTNGRSQEESKKRDKDQKGEESKRDERSSKEDVQADKGEPVTVDETVVLEMDGELVPEDGTVVMEVDWISEEGIVVSNLGEGWISSIDVAQETEDEGIPTEVEVSVGGELYRDRSEVPDVLPTLDFNELIQNGAMTRVEFPKLTDDFYVKFNSTGFKYFEEWEQAKLDCEEEFKDFVDEAENNLDLISDDESDFESELGGKFNFEVENQKTVRNLLRGWGNFKKSLVFDPAKSEFYKWTNGKFYQKFRRKSEQRRGSLEKNESDESIKENIERRKRVSDPSESPKSQKGKNKENLARERKALHLKLLNKYRRKALRQGTHKRRHRRKKTSSESWGIKEKNDNQSASDVNVKNLRDYEPEKGFLFKSEVMGVSENCSGKSEGVVGFNLVDGENCEKSTNRRTELEGSKMGLVTGVDSSAENHRVNSLSQAKNDFERKSGSGLGNVGNLPESPVDSGVFSESPDSQKKKKGFVEELVKQKPKAQGLYLKNESLKCDSLIQKCNLPLSPESDDANVKLNGVSSQNLTSGKNKRVHKPTTEDGRKRRKQRSRNNCQKYDSQDLYKPRLLLNSSRMRNREKGSDVDY